MTKIVQWNPYAADFGVILLGHENIVAKIIFIIISMIMTFKLPILCRGYGDLIVISGMMTTRIYCMV